MSIQWSCGFINLEFHKPSRRLLLTHNVRFYLQRAIQRNSVIAMLYVGWAMGNLLYISLSAKQGKMLITFFSGRYDFVKIEYSSDFFAPLRSNRPVFTNSASIRRSCQSATFPSISDRIIWEAVNHSPALKFWDK